MPATFDGRRLLEGEQLRVFCTGIAFAQGCASARCAGSWDSALPALEVLIDKARKAERIMEANHALVGVRGG
jgi:hypothetical protein